MIEYAGHCSAFLVYMMNSVAFIVTHYLIFLWIIDIVMIEVASKKIHVAVGVLMNTSGHILLSKRAAHQHQGDLWEFPGGKVEVGESVLGALIREFQEEVNVTIKSAEPLLESSHDYGDKHVLLDVWLSAEFTGEVKGNENQQIRWVAVNDLASYDFPEANKVIIEKLLTLY